MKIGFISDLHIDINSDYPVVQSLKQVIREKEVEMLVLAGDTFNMAELTVEFARSLEKELGIIVKFIFGNHEYYETNNNFNYWRAQQSVFPFVVDDYTIIGDTGWYDYSWALSDGGLIRKGKAKGLGGTWSDHRWIKYPEEIVGDTATWFHNENYKSIEKQSKMIQTNKTIVVMHMVPHYKFLVSTPEYRTTNAFFGSEPISKLITSIAPNYCIYGHTHWAKTNDIGNTQYTARPIGYYFEWNNKIYDRINKYMLVLDTKTGEEA